MAVKWAPGYNAATVAAEIEAIKRVDPSGRVSFDALRFWDWEAILFSMLEFPEPIPETEARRIATQAAFAAAGAGTVTPQRLLAAVNRLTQAFLDRDSERYVLVATLSLPQAGSMPRIRLDNSDLIFAPQLSRRFQEDRARLELSARPSLFAEPPTDHGSVRVHVSARSPFEAADAALTHLDFVRGTWNWLLNSRTLLNLSPGRTLPVNRITLGPVHTVHRPNGKAAVDAWWYDGNYCQAVRVYAPSNSELQDMSRFLRDVRHRLATCAYRETLEEAIVRYCRALDLHDWESAFLKLWSTLELLTDSSMQGNQVAIQRAAYIHKDREYALHVLRHLRQYRNRSVHLEEHSESIQTYVYQLKRFVEALLEFHIGNQLGLSSLSEATEFLDLPTDRNALERRVRLADGALRFHGYL